MDRSIINRNAKNIRKIGHFGSKKKAKIWVLGAKNYFKSPILLKMCPMNKTGPIRICMHPQKKNLERQLGWPRTDSIESVKNVT